MVILVLILLTVKRTAATKSLRLVGIAMEENVVVDAVDDGGDFVALAVVVVEHYY